jgi:hypothetical protein
MTSMELKKSHYRHEEWLGFKHAGEMKSPDGLRHIREKPRLAELHPTKIKANGHALGQLEWQRSNASNILIERKDVLCALESMNRQRAVDLSAPQLHSC